jgi:hypothetical protein
MPLVRNRMEAITLGELKMPNWVTNKVQAPSHVIRAMLNAEVRRVPLAGRRARLKSWTDD